VLREVIFYPVARRAALPAVFLYSGFYHEFVSFMARGGYGGPALYFLLKYPGVVIVSQFPVERQGRAVLAVRLRRLGNLR
jgi:hypothetical protein